MIDMLLVVICFCFLISLLCAGGGGWSLIICAVCIAMFALRRGLIRKLELEKMKERWIYIAGIALIVICIIGDTVVVPSNEMTNYSKGLEKVAKLLQIEKTEEIYVILDELEEKYGATEAIIINRVAALLQDCEYEKALEETQRYPDKHTGEYYTMCEAIYISLGEKGEEPLKELYLQGAKDWPDWLDMQIYAGIVQLEREEYSSAEYFFSRAYEIDNKQGMTLYLLGITQYELREYDKCIKCFAMAYEAGVEDYVAVSMQEYMQKILEEV